MPEGTPMKLQRVRYTDYKQAIRNQSENAKGRV
jgi:hypothetical protein